MDIKESTNILMTSSVNNKDELINWINSNAEVITIEEVTEINDIPIVILEDFECSYLKENDNLTNIDNIKLNILKSIVSKKDTIVFNNVLTYVGVNFKNKVISKLKKQKKKIINYTTEIEETLLLDYTIVKHKDKIIMEGNTKDILLEEKILKRLGFNLPFIVELSNGLKLYGLIDKTYYDIESLVNDLWK